MDPATMDGVVGSLAQLGPAGVIAGGWIFSLLRRLTIATDRIKELEDRHYKLLMDVFAQEQSHHD